MNNLHIDVLETLINYQRQRVKNGELLTNSEVMEFLDAQSDWVMHNYDQMSEKALEYGRLILDKQSTIKIYDLFLANHRLDEEFENFYMRILRRKYRDKE